MFYITWKYEKHAVLRIECSIENTLQSLTVEKKVLLHDTDSIYVDFKCYCYPTYFPKKEKGKRREKKEKRKKALNNVLQECYTTYYIILYIPHII